MDDHLLLSKKRGSPSAPLTTSVRSHYDKMSRFYRAFWGEHLHHGYWEGDESPPDVAQVRLIEELWRRSRIPRGAAVLDVGCGLGGSALWMAAKRGCDVTALTLSRVQVKLASRQARRRGLSSQVTFLQADASQLDQPPGSFDAVWVVECSEHLEDKASFIRKCAEVLKPGGVLALCAWVDSSRRDEQRRLIDEICDRMLCPGLGRLEDYTEWMKAAGFHTIHADDIAPYVSRTWDYCSDLLARRSVRLLIRTLDRRRRRFARSFPLMKLAFETGAMGYGMFAAWKRA